MKIVQISPYAMDRPGGVQTHVRDLSSWLRRQGHEVRIIAPSGHCEEDDITQLGSFRSMALHGTAFEISRASRAELKDCTRSLQDWGAEVVHLHTPWTPMMAWQLWRQLKLPSIAMFHATLPDDTGFDPFTWYIRRAARYFHKRLDCVTVPSLAPQAQWQQLQVPTVPEILPPTIDLSRWHAARTPRSGPLHVLYMGRLEERKGVRVLLEAWPKIAAVLEGARLTIAGGGEQEAQLRALVSSQAIPRVTFLPPPSNAQAPALMASADVFAAPATEGESFGLVLIEAMAAGALPIAAANAGFTTVLTGAGSDLLVPPGDAGAFAKKILSIASDKERRKGLQFWAKTHASAFDVGTCGPAFLSLYQTARQRALTHR
ncbi:Phosphatidylinositol alpha-mannosyltransferase [Shimia gijangensis]|uniref:Phosphatidylinositol alpha-mannosyltransferase n=1 Tax=Shimia gijangensis TaxID=1470563 RepID=A0A1M6JT23_9RHOB|nr:glycosyltransferase family 4 protein [Shimia gijangensis]SHJ49894.1 Phosphatidylinositol alpha-mannosyltransferase [Shimia gijangensis]